MDKRIHYIQKCLRHGSYRLLIFIVFFLFTSGEQGGREVRILFTGDILLSRNVKMEMESRGASPWENLKGLFYEADIVAGNLEGAVADSQSVKGKTGTSPIFNIDKKDIRLLKEAGFKILTLENNHSHDFSEEGKRSTVDAVRDDSLSAVFLDNSPQFYTTNGVVISLISVNLVQDAGTSAAKIPSVGISQKLRLARSLSNLVIVSIHWGSELLDWPSREQRDAADWLTKNGADIIVGSHPHVVQNPELVNGKPVFFSLGNHLFDQKYPPTKQGMIADIRIVDGKFTCRSILTQTQRGSFYPEIFKTGEDCLGPFPLDTPIFKLGNYTMTPLSVAEGYENRVILQAFDGGKLCWESNPLPVVSVFSFNPDGRREYLLALEKHYSRIDKEENLRPYVYGFDNAGLYAAWRGSALSWPLLDAQIFEKDSKQYLCVLHRGDSFINPNKNTTTLRVGTYKWNGFGFTGLNDSVFCQDCQKFYDGY